MKSGWYRLLLMLVFTGVTLYGAEEIRVVIMHTNDIQGHVLPGPDAAGSARLAAVVREMKPDLMLDAGDSMSGTLISDAFQGQAVLDMMNAIGYDAAALGIDEFNFGIEALRERARQANFPLLSANTTSPVSDIQDAAIYNAQGIRIGVIGLTSEDLPVAGRLQNVKYVDVADVIRTLENVMPRVRNRVDAIVLLANVGRADEERIARAYPEIRLIIGAHEEAEVPARIGQTTIVSAGRHGKYVGRVDLTFNDGRINRVEPRLIPLMTASPEPEITRLLEPYEAALNKMLQTVVGHAAADLSRSIVEESPVGNLVADAVNAKTGTQITLINAADAQAGIPKGPITGRTLFELLPSKNTLVTMRLSGAQIKRILGRTVMNVSGVRVKLDTTKPEGKRLVSVRLADGTPLRDKNLYTVTTNDFLLMGGDGFTEFASGIDVEDTAIVMRDAVAEHISRLGTVAPRLDGRIQVSR